MLKMRFVAIGSLIGSVAAVGLGLGFAASAAPSSYRPARTPSGFYFIRNGDVWSADVDGSNQRQITKEGDIEHYFYSPQTGKIVYDAIIEDAAQIKTMDPTTGAVEVMYANRDDAGSRRPHKRLTPRALELAGPGYHYVCFWVSPDGMKIALCGDYLRPKTGPTIVYDSVRKTVNEIPILPV